MENNILTLSENRLREILLEVIAHSAPEQKKEKPAYLSIEEAVVFLKDNGLECNQSTLYNAHHRKKISAKKVNKRLLFTELELKKFLGIL